MYQHISRIILTLVMLSVGGGVRVLGVIPLLYSIYLIFMWAIQCHMLFPTMALPPVNGGQPKDAAVKWVDDADGVSCSEGWFFEAAGEGSAPTVLVFHGNGEYINSYVSIARWFTSLGYNVLLPEYRGYGKSVGTPVEHDLIHDMKAHIDLAASSFPRFDKNRLIYYGISVGGGIACSLSASVPPQALILQSTFYSIPRIATDFLIPEFLSHILLYNIYDNSNNLKKLAEKTSVPILLGHGTEDTIVPFEHAQLLSQEQNVAIFERECGHNDFTFDDDYQQRIITFLATNEKVATVGTRERKQKADP
eukprot:TRINITY_DN1491_c4_g1_i1.p1 TRINITY_DN1491_c4_g1~~TRINITY_DN1491_c4_g1_i1.p1  ORF type:complete len:307 (+),score=47.30 TRINITY_DN1491_c4_g1_i1:80-1000(+)